MSQEKPNDISPAPEKASGLPANLKGKRVVLVNHSDNVGGAAIVTFRLMVALRREGVDARMVVFTKHSEEERVSVVGTRFERGLRFCAERLGLLHHCGYSYENIFKVSTGNFAINVHRHEWVREADIVCLNWINQGLLGLKGIRRLHRMGKKLVWTLHDMWAFTGICHHSYECEHFKDACGNCMYLRHGGFPNDISHRIWKRKMALYDEVPITFVTVSNWLEQKARSSSLLRARKIMTIHNPFPIEQFYTKPPRHLDSLFTYTKPNLILFAAARLDDPIKGIDYAIDALNHVFDNYPEIASSTAVYFFGGMKDPRILDRLHMSHRWLGRISDFKIVRYLYASAKVVLSTSLYESLPGTLIEGQAGGALPVTFGRGGQTDIVEHKKNGYIARYKDSVSVAEGIIWALGNNGISRESLHESVRERFAAPVIARKYIDLFSSLIG